MLVNRSRICKIYSRTKEFLLASIFSSEGREREREVTSLLFSLQSWKEFGSEDNLREEGGGGEMLCFVVDSVWPESIDSSGIVGWLVACSGTDCWRNARGPSEGRSSSRWKRRKVAHGSWEREIPGKKGELSGKKREGRRRRERGPRNICQSQRQEDRSGKVDLTPVKEAIPLRRMGDGATPGSSTFLDLRPFTGESLPSAIIGGRMEHQ